MKEAYLPAKSPLSLRGRSRSRPHPLHATQSVLLPVARAHASRLAPGVQEVRPRRPYCGGL